MKKATVPQSAPTATSKASKKPDVTAYLNLVERVAKVEYRRVPNHMIDYEELVSIGAIAVQNILSGKTVEQVAKMNISYIATATRWAIRNELRSRYKWYTHKLSGPETVTEEDASASTEGKTAEQKTNSPESIREAVYETILSIDGISEGPDGDSSYDCIKDGSATPEEYMEIIELGRAIKKAIEFLPPKERTIVEYRFYRNMQVKEIAALVGLSSSRITRIVQASLDQVREILKEQGQI